MPLTAVYLVGFALVIAGLAYGGSLLGIPEEWITAGVIVLIGVRLLKLSKRGRSRDASGMGEEQG